MAILDAALLTSALRLSTPLILAAQGGLIAERSGILNLGLEGMMLSGAFAGVIVTHFTGSPWLGLLAAIVVGGLVGLFHGYLSIRWRANQVLSGLAMTQLALGLTGFLLQVFFKHGGNSPSVQKLPAWQIPGLASIPFVGQILSGHNLLVYLALLLPFAIHIGLHRTPWGIWLKAAGEHPRALETFGIQVTSVRYIAVFISGALAGLGGAYLSLGQMALFSENMTAGRGFIAVAAVIFGKWQPTGVMLAAILFGFLDALQLNLQISGIGIPKEIFLSLPYVVTVLVLAGLVGKAKGPASVGQPYEREGR